MDLAVGQLLTFVEQIDEIGMFSLGEGMPTLVDEALALVQVIEEAPDDILRIHDCSPPDSR